jgi:ADP-heptose:LPS heptosyltransferase
LRRAGAEVTLLAPEGPGSALVGEGPEEARRIVAWDGRDAARLIAGEADVPAFGRFEAALCYSRSADVARALESVSPRVVVHDPAPASEHAAAWLARPLSALGIPVVAPVSLVATDEERDVTHALRERLPPRFLAVHPGSGSARKNWPAERFAELAARLSNGAPWLLSLGPADEREAAALHAAPGAVITRDLPPRHLGALLASAGLYVGNDSGVSHLAAAYGAPTLALFGPTDPAAWSPIGTRVRVLRASNEDLSQLGVNEVEDVANAVQTVD